MAPIQRGLELDTSRDGPSSWCWFLLSPLSGSAGEDECRSDCFFCKSSWGGESLAEQLGHCVCALVRGASLGALALRCAPGFGERRKPQIKGWGVCGAGCVVGQIVLPPPRDKARQQDPRDKARQQDL